MFLLAVNGSLLIDHYYQPTRRYKKKSFFQQMVKSTFCDWVMPTAHFQLQVVSINILEENK